MKAHKLAMLTATMALASVLAEGLGRSGFNNHGQRVVTGQRLMQASSDIFLGWLHDESGLDDQPRDFYARQLRDWKGSAQIEQMTAGGLASTEACVAGRSHGRTPAAA